MSDYQCLAGSGGWKDSAGDVVALTSAQSLGPSIGCGMANDRLYTSRIVVREDCSMTAVFAAHVASNPQETVAALARRFGAAIAAKARIEEGFDRCDPYVATFVSPFVADEIDRVAADPRSWAHRQYELVVERRFGI